MLTHCPCFSRLSVSRGLKSGIIHRKGYYWRKSESRWIQRYYCRSCRRCFSSACFSACYFQKRRRLNPKVRDLLCSGVSIRRAALLLHANRKTIARKLCFLANEERLREDQEVKKAIRSTEKAVSEIIFDEVETSLHSKLKPASIALAVTPERIILGFEVSVMPAKGKTAHISRKKYGTGQDHRRRGLTRTFSRLRSQIPSEHLHSLKIRSDECPRYPKLVCKYFPGAQHIQFKGVRGCVAGQGELKRIGFDPLFALNHTAAMFRANVNRLFRKTWCTSKRIDRLSDHLTLYMAFHNRRIRMQNLASLRKPKSDPGTGTIQSPDYPA
jgi:hypothetical protein